MHASRLVTTVFPLSLALAGAAYGQDFPNRPIRILTSLPGGGSDFAARLIAQGISGSMGQPVIVENRPSALTGEIAMKAQPDGYTVLLDGDSFYLGPLITKTPYDVFKDFTPVTIGLLTPNIVVVHPSVPVNSINELIALAKAKPGQLNYASSGLGSSQQYAAEMLKHMAGISITHVPYKGSGPALTGLLAAEVQMFAGSAAAVMPHLKTGKVRALAVTTAKPSALLPNIPTVAAAANLPDYDLTSRTGIFAAGKPPKAVIARLNQEIVRAINSPEIKAKFAAVGVETITDTPDESIANIKVVIEKMAKVIKAAGIKVD